MRSLLSHLRDKKNNEVFLSSGIGPVLSMNGRNQAAKENPTALIATHKQSCSCGGFSGWQYGK